MGRQYEDNYMAVRASMAAQILASALGACVRNRQALQAAADGDGEPSNWSFLSCEFVRAGTSVDIGVKASQRDRMYGPTADADGNEWAQYELEFSVNYPSHGSASPAVVLARVALVQAVAMLAAELQASLDRPVHRMLATAQQVAERKAAAAQAELDRKVQALVEFYRGGIRPGGHREIPAVDSVGMAHGIPAGAYRVQVGKSMYSLHIEHDGGKAILNRHPAEEAAAAG